ncbi:MAG: hypothetical protein J5I98_15920, partial [Phaeodactylibacter sp.]|nr:hypothetical protein [Phaeodactylibacter sp.]
VLLRRKCQILGSHEGIFPPHSSATGRKNGKVRFQKLAFAAKMTASKHALKDGFIVIWFHGFCKRTANGELLLEARRLKVPLATSSM